MVVVDTNVIAYLWLPGDLSDYSERGLLKDPVWCAPYLWRSEFRNILSRYVFSTRMNLNLANQIMDEALNLLCGFEYHPDSKLIMTIVKESYQTPYDGEFIALAKQLNVPFLTTDKKLLKAFPEIAVSLKSFVS